MPTDTGERLQELLLGARFMMSLRPFVRHPVTSAEARETLANRLSERVASFLWLMRDGVYRHKSSPYRDLLRIAGCEYGDLEGLVRREDIEGALAILAQRGVYLTVDEFKGRVPVVRGSTTLDVEPSLLGNPLAAKLLPAQSSGSRGATTLVGVDLASIREIAMNRYLVLDAQGGTGWQHAVWAVPGGAAIATVLNFVFIGLPPVRWFSLVNPDEPHAGARYRWSARAVRWGSLLGGLRLPGPEFVPMERPLPIARWMADVLASGATPHLFTSTSCGVRLCQAAGEAGIDLRGAKLTVGGEPITPARAAEIGKVGATAIPRYASIECGRIGYACLSPEQPDEVHVAHDQFAFHQVGTGGPLAGLQPNDLMVTSLRPTSRLITINLSMGDQAVLSRRVCGCPVEGLGWPVHLHTIRSREKLTAGGMAFTDTDVIRVLEEVLPARFGGAPTHYQLVEEEAEDGDPRIRLLVHPVVGPLDEGELVDVFLEAIGPGSGGERLMGEVWRGAGFVRVERAEPLLTGSGKIMHLHGPSTTAPAT